MKIVECVPNISEGRNPEIYNAVAQAAAAVSGVELLDVDPGQETNRTVITFVGEPEAVLEGAFELVKRSFELIDMRTHHGAHGRQGATDVCPFVPVSGVTMDDCVELAHRLGKRVGEELGLPVYLYEYAATRPERRSLGRYPEGRVRGPGREAQDARIRARFRPRDLCAELWRHGDRRAQVPGRLQRRPQRHRQDGGPTESPSMSGRRDGWSHGPDGTKVQQPGMLKAVRGMGWFIPEYGCAQVSMNLIDLDVTPVHVAFDACDESARERGIRVTGSELVGLIPKSSMLDAGMPLSGEGWSDLRGVPESDVIHAAIRSLGLNEVSEFNAKEKIIEDILAPERPLAALTLQGFRRRDVARFHGARRRIGGGVGRGSCGGAGGHGGQSAAPQGAFAKVRDELEEVAVRGQELKQTLARRHRRRHMVVPATDGCQQGGRRGQGRGRAGRDPRRRSGASRSHRSVPRGRGAVRRAPENSGWRPRHRTPASAPPWRGPLLSGAAMNVRINLQDMADDAEAAAMLERADEALAETTKAAADSRSRGVELSRGW